MKKTINFLIACLTLTIVPVTAQINTTDSDAKTVTILAVNDMHAAIDSALRSR